ncbi:hypothetical protein M7I_7669 [Glarea lozoyensis 74030]|uniref:Uncharacterized protein n=1 Tax=Glarea lozoyensis (strain ATCC 74030 / MF5533) TaxID=1104152 RepID=H0EXX6_GLAL7|nr:hypothetical protein M7I_7669 [Glarea lozoyensis 74030]
MTLVFENWTAISEHVEAGRLPSEASFTSQELRMDRLERLIREERLVNDGMERVDEEADVEDDEDDDLYFAGVHRDEDLSSEVDENEDASDDDDSVDDDERFADADEDEDVTFVRGPNSTRWA